MYLFANHDNKVANYSLASKYILDSQANATFLTDFHHLFFNLKKTNKQQTRNQIQRNANGATQTNG